MDHEATGGRIVADDEEYIRSTIPLWHNELRGFRSHVVLRWALTVLGLAVFILTALSIFSGALYLTETKLSSLTIWIVDFDSLIPPYDSLDAVIGPLVTEMIMTQSSQTMGGLNFVTRPPINFQNNPMAVRQKVYNEDAYAAIIINANATSSLQESIAFKDASYDPLGAAQIIYNSARDETTYYNYIIPTLNQLKQVALDGFGPRWIEILTKNGLTNISNVPPQALNPAIGFTEIDLRPFGPAVATPAVSIGLIYLIIISFFAFPFLIPIHSQLTLNKKHRPVKASHMIIWRLFSNFVVYLILSFFYSLVPLAFQIPFTNSPEPAMEPARNANAYGKSSFVVYWMLNWIGMAALGLPSENMAMILGAPWSALWLTFWVISNVSTGFYPLNLASNFYKWGYVWPLHRIVEGSRTILFGTYSRIGLDFGVLLGWIGVSIILFPVATAFLGWKSTRLIA
ncbi:hypothetical protein BGW36DRAFT_422596 [Talaromyces proteolyticus]|uniref:DUF3533 domain-containing protein n=1 Tax=Talaromyces proteolyticus TaxID=1131652 RepID=A0AAD4KWW0_9EURO|nr:uncharacterized protein BGW36DRAFT_422596 [Talaromyces proteolyticus]KAH8703015.1 hypothetical protein BGW36DRAFT_422596 [Talaromyces proteolyticus]